jgi:carnitine 3-dehydrogenase
MRAGLLIYEKGRNLTQSVAIDHWRVALSVAVGPRGFVKRMGRVLTPIECAAWIGEVENAARRCRNLIAKRTDADEGAAFHDTLADAVDGAVWVQESVPEQRDETQCLPRHPKRTAQRTRSLRPRPLASSRLVTGAMRPEQIVVCHPFNLVALPRQVVSG